MIVVIDYGLGNVGSVANMLEELDIENEITCNPEIIRQADKLILPGVGSYDKGMSLFWHAAFRKKKRGRKLRWLGVNSV